MSYTVLARRYRSTDFGQVIGQEPIARTLQNAIATGRVAHAYLFTGTRGVGKTSMARLLACALNAPDSIPDCPKLPGEREYPSKEVQARMAEAIRRGDDLNVIEIDGASNRSVEEARQLIANAGLSPTGQAIFKIYIIDEVHMLTREAFNALLKTMEEPPAHVKFILCTTESHKVPATIQSRCQRFDFRAIPTAAIADHLTAVLKQEKIAADKQVVTQVAKLGNGSMRDALSLLDRLIAAAGEGAKGKKPNLSAELLEQMLGLPDQEAIVSLIDALASGDVAAALTAAAALLDRGIGQEQFINVLIEYLRQMMLIHVCGVDSNLVELTDEARDKAAQQAQQFDASGLVYMIALCENLQRSSRSSSSPRALLDATIVRLALAEKMADVAALLAGQAPAPTVTTTTPPVPLKKKVAPPNTVEINPTEAPPSPPVVASPVEQDEVWPTVLAAVRDQPNMSWVRHLDLLRLDDQTARVAPQPGHRDLASFIDARRCQQLADLFKTVIGRPVRVELEMTEARAASPGSEQPLNQPASRTQGSAPAPRRPVTQADRALAMAQPLVKQVMETFDASVVGVYPEKQPPPEKN